MKDITQVMCSLVSLSVRNISICASQMTRPPPDLGVT